MMALLIDRVVLDEYSLRNEHICYIYQENRGISSTRNKGLELYDV